MQERARGFTLIELMIVVAIIGILSSMAIPSFRNYQLRAKQAERAMITKAIRVATDEYYARDGSYPNTWTDPGPPPMKYSWLNGPYNPGWPPMDKKRRFDPMLGDWRRLNLGIVGHVYYTYYLYAYDYGPVDKGGYIYTWGDLDGDGRTNSEIDQWYPVQVWSNGRLVTVQQEYTQDYYFSEKTF